ncbi:peptidase M20C, Xaa-His dipeptidase, partial [Kipferlia bialata]
ADNGIGVAFGLAIITDKTLKTGRIEVFITKDEETTMEGAIRMSPDLLKCQYLVNCDSEDFGIITIGSAGGFDSNFNFKAEPETVEGDLVTVKVSKLTGGHSGCDIHFYRANAVKVITRLLQKLQPSGIVSMEAGNAPNAIPLSAEAVVICDK